MRGRTWLRKNRYAHVFIEGQWGIQNGGAWRYMRRQRRQLFYLVYLSLLICAWFADTKREITLNRLRSKTCYSFSYHSYRKHRPCREKTSLSSLLCNVLFYHIRCILHTSNPVIKSISAMVINGRKKSGLLLWNIAITHWNILMTLFLFYCDQTWHYFCRGHLT